MKKILKITLISLLIAMPYMVNAEESFKVVSGLSPFFAEELFKDIPEIACKGRKYSSVIAFLILVGSSITYYSKSKGVESIIKHSMTTAAVAIAITFTPVMLNWLDKFTYHLVENVGNFNPSKCIDNVFKTSTLLSASSKKETVENQEDFKYSITSAIETTKEWLADMIQKCGRWIALKLVGGWLSFSSFVCSTITAVRYFLVHMASMALPIFLAGLSTESFRSQSANYIYGLIGIICWPIGWATGHIGTESLLSFAIRILQASTKSHLPENEWLLNNFGEALNGREFDISAASIFDGLYITHTSIFITFIITLIFIGFWIIIVSFCGPIVIQKVIASGGQFFSGVTAGAYQSTTQSTGRVGESIFSPKDKVKDSKYSEAKSKAGLTESKGGQSFIPKFDSNNINSTQPESPQSGGEANIGSQNGSLLNNTLKTLKQMGYTTSVLVSKASKITGDPSQIADLFTDGKKPGILPNIHE